MLNVAAVIVLVFQLFKSAEAGSIKLKRIESTRNRQILSNEWLKRTVLSDDHTSVIPRDFYDLEYIAEIYLGSARTPLRVVLDTGSSDFWVPDVTCGHCDYYCHGLWPKDCDKLCGDGCCSNQNNFTRSKCLKKQFFDAKTSTTYEERNGIFRLRYGSGEASGFYGSDILEFGGMRTRVVFGQVTETAAVLKYDPNFDGIFGLAFQSLSVDKIRPPFLAAYEQGLVPKAIFTAFLKNVGFHLMEDGGEFTFGEIDAVNCDVADLKYVPLTFPAYFQFKLGGFSLGTYEVNQLFEVISDTGTSFIKAPQFVVERTAEIVNATIYTGGYRVPCELRNSFAEMRFWIGGYVYTIPSSNYILQVGTSLCELGMASMEGAAIGPQWILGNLFIRQYCNVYDIENQRIGFAKPRH